jgi:hypothetical protein
VGAEYNLPRCSLALIPYHDYVVAGTFKKLREYIARLAGTVDPKDSLVGAQALYFYAGGGRDIFQYL